ncbi:hypothetical protein HNQ88_000873 [Aureibacter tunicatorum]|uniref:Uncharacterized protein n=1 Tax=Aureibacter tunicatorum TaxID=866807 RepID=A0AAE4BS25_9BACT|nr:hypothetical protein [Aureibacter tunicatorum]BDD02930.1 hypothetical protein AUTU_04130 [Aureibacter tunicatorum]
MMTTSMLYSQSIEERMSLKYECNTKYIKSYILLNKNDSTYVYNSWSHAGLNVIDSGTWKYRCNMLIFNSTKTYTKNTKDQRRNKINKRLPLFTNSCFLFQGDSIIQESNYFNYVFKVDKP